MRFANRKRRSRKTPLTVRWCTGNMVQEVPNNPTQFELETVRLGIAHKPESWRYEPSLRRFAESNRHKRFVPEFLLVAWGLELFDQDVNIAGL